MKFIKRHKIFTIIFLVICVGVLFIIFKKFSPLAKPADKYKTVKVKRENLTETVSATGRVQSENQVNLKFQTSGLLAWVGVKEGDRVKKWQAIASLDKRELRKKLEKEMQDYLNERWDFEQTQEDYKEIKERHLVTDKIKRILEKAQFDLNSAVLDYEIQNLAVELATIISPIDGIVTHIDTPVAGVNITPATAIFTIADPSKMKFVANIDEADIGKIKLGQKTTIILDAYPKEKIEGKITKIAFSSVTTRGGGTAYPVEISLPENINQRFKIGMNGDVEILITEKKEVLTLPNQAIKEKNGKKYVRLIEGRNINQAEVETGFEGETKTEITKGVKEGQIVILQEKKR